MTTDTVDRAEKSLLGCLLASPAARHEVLAVLRPDHFRADAHQRVYRAILALAADGRPVDLVTLAEQLERQGDLDDVGGHAAVGELWQAGGTGGEAPYHAEIVRGASVKRRLVSAGRAITYQASNGCPASEALEEAQKAVFAIAEDDQGGAAVPVSKALSETLERIGRVAAGAAGLPTGFACLDDLTGGLHDSELLVLAARPSVGKTAMALALVLAAARRGVGSLLCSLEMSRPELGVRLLCMAARVNVHHARQGSLGEEERVRLLAARDSLAQLPVHIDDAATQGVLRIGSAARRLRARHGIGLVVVDYLQLVEPEDKKANRHEQITQVSRRLKALAKELSAPVVALAQLNRESEQGGRRRPRLSDLRESGGIEATADAVWLLHRPEEESTADPEVIELLVAKQRNGPVGRVALHYHRRWTLFDELPLDVFPED